MLEDRIIPGISSSFVYEFFFTIRKNPPHPTKIKRTRRKEPFDPNLSTQSPDNPAKMFIFRLKMHFGFSELRALHLVHLGSTEGCHLDTLRPETTTQIIQKTVFVVQQMSVIRN